jgi:hypothetical protein
MDDTRAHDRVNAAQTVNRLSLVQRPTNLGTQSLNIGRMTIRMIPEWGAIIIAASPDNRRIAGIGDDFTIIFWDFENKQKVFDLLVKQTNRVQLELLSYIKV